MKGKRGLTRVTSFPPGEDTRGIRLIMTSVGQLGEEAPVPERRHPPSWYRRRFPKDCTVKDHEGPVSAIKYY